MAKKQLEFHDEPPPPTPTGGSRRTSVAESALTELRAHPNKWALIHTASKRQTAINLAGMIRTARIHAAQPRGSFEATCRGRDVWARYVGDPA